MPQETLFISDLHLSPQRPATTDLFLQFLRERAAKADALYILGDLFDAWIGDDDDTPAFRQVRAGLRELTAAGPRCFFIHGNRDFLIGRGFSRDTGVTLLKDPTIVPLGDEPVLLMHGDLLCTDDIAYQRFRRRIRNPIVIRLFLWRSLARRRAVATSYRNKSGDATAMKAPDIMDVNQQTVENRMSRYRSLHLIHGHTHRPADHRFKLGGRPALRSVLAEWHPDRGEVLVHRDGKWSREAVQAARGVSQAGSGQATGCCPQL